MTGSSTSSSSASAPWAPPRSTSSACAAPPCLGIDQFKPPHEFGSSHGDTRITRIACGEGPEYSVFARRSHEIWRELERKTGRELLTQNGLLVISGQGQRSTGHGIPEFLQTTIKAAEAAEVPYETMTGAEAKRRFPAFNLRDDDIAYFDKVGGFVRPEACVADAARTRGSKRRRRSHQ